MARPRIPSASPTAHAIFRAFALVASVVLFANVIYECIIWGREGKVYWLSVIASLIAIILDSFEVAALVDSTRIVPRIAQVYLVCGDLSVLCLSGLSILFIFSSDWHRQDDSSDGSWPWTDADLVSLGATYFICALRSILLAWSCLDYHRTRRSGHVATTAPSL